MKTLTGGQRTSIGGEGTTLARIMSLTLANGVTYYYTDSDLALIVDGQTYLSGVGFDCSAVQTDIGTKSSTVTVGMFLDASGVTRDLIEAGVVDSALCLVSIVDWEMPTNGAFLVFKGHATQHEYKDGNIVSLTLDALLSKDLMLNVDLYSSNCRVDLGSVKCGVNIDTLKKTFIIGAVSNKQQFATNLTDADAAFDNGIVVFTSGSNNGFALEVQGYLNASGMVTLQLIAPFAILPGDTGTIYPGCNHTPTNCALYGNIVNFRGEPYTAPLVATTPNTPSATSATGLFYVS